MFNRFHSIILRRIISASRLFFPIEGREAVVAFIFIEMQLSKAANYALRFSYAQKLAKSGPADRVVCPYACLLATIGIMVSTFSVKQMLASSRRSTF